MVTHSNELTYREYSARLKELEINGALRSLPRREDGLRLDLTSNDYLGLASSTRYENEFLKSLNPEEIQLTSSASRLLCVRTDSYTELEDYLEEAYNKPALFFDSGYHLNTGLIPALALPGTLIVADKLVHASIIDGIRLSGAPFKRFRHNDMDSLHRILEQNHDDFERIILIAESIYSMDGDAAPLRELVELKKKYPKIILYLDEAHALGVKGESGLGFTEELGLIQEIDILAATLGKALASAGAFAIMSQELKDWAVNTCRSLIFSTALPPISAKFSLFMLRTMGGMKQERKHLNGLYTRFAQGIAEITSIPTQTQSPIVPWITKGNKRTVMAANILREKGFLAMPIRKPTVPEGLERIRFSLGAHMEDSDIDSLLQAVEETQTAICSISL